MSVVVSSSGSIPQPQRVVPPLNLQQINSVRLSIPSPAQTPSDPNTLSEHSSISIQDAGTPKVSNEDQCKENVQPTIQSSRSVFKDRPYLKEKKQRTLGVRDKMALFDLYPPSLTDIDKKIISEDMINISRPINTQKFLLKRFPMLRQNPEKDKSKGGGFVERPPLSPTVRGEQQVYNQQVYTTTVDPSAGLDTLPKSVQAPFAKDIGALNSKLHIPQLPLDTLDMLTTDAFGNSLNSVRVNWVKSEDDLTRSVTLTSRSDAVFTRSSFNRVASAGSTRRYSGLKNVPSSSKSLPSTARKKVRTFMEESPSNENSKLDESKTRAQSPSPNNGKDEDFEFNQNSETEQLIYDSLRTSYYLNLKEEKAKRKGQETITIEEHVKVTNDIIFKVTSAFKEKVKKIQLSMRKEIERIMKKYSSELDGVKEERSDNIVNSFVKDKQIRRQLDKLKEQMTDLRKKYDDASNLLNEMAVYKERYESMKKEMDKMINGRPAKTAEQTLSKIMSNDDKLSSKEKQDLMADFIKHFFNEDGTLNEKALFEMFMVNKELHENLSRTRDTVSYVSLPSFYLC